MYQNENQSYPNHREKVAQGALGALRKEFLVIGKTRVKSWHAWLLIGVAAGIAAGIVFVANRSGEFETTGAQAVPPPQPVRTQIVTGQRADGNTTLGNNREKLLLAQSFTIPKPDSPSSSVTIEKVSFALARKRNPNQPITVSIRETLTGNSLFSIQVQPSGLSEQPTSPTWVDVPLATPLTVTPARTYFLALSLEKADGSHYYHWLFERRSSYKEGSLFERGRQVAEDALVKIHLVVTPPTPIPPSVVTPACAKPHVFKFFIDSSLISDMEFARRVLPKYVQDMNFILAKNTTRCLVFNPVQGIIPTTQVPYKTKTPPPAPKDGFEIWADVQNIVNLRNIAERASWTSDESGAAVLVNLKWKKLYDPENLQDRSGDFIDYWTYMNTMLHELAHVYNAGKSEYYNLESIEDVTGVEPILHMNMRDPDDPYWKERQDFYGDPLLTRIVEPEVPIRIPRLRSEILQTMRYSALTAAIIDESYRDTGLPPLPDMNKIKIRVTDRVSESSISSANIKIWTRAKGAIQVDGFTNSAGELMFAWSGGHAPGNNVKLIKVYKEGYLSSAKYISVFDAEMERILKGKTEWVVDFPLEAAPYSLSVLYPDGGEAWEVGSARTIRWSTTKIPDTHSLAAMSLLDTQGRRHALLQNVANDGSEQIIVPDIAPGSYKLEISTVINDQRVVDTSDEQFRIVESNLALRIISPNGGEEWEMGTEQTIKWINPFVEFSGSLFMVDASDTSRVWSIPSPAHLRFTGESSAPWLVGSDLYYQNFRDGPKPGSYIFRICQRVPTGLGVMKYVDCKESDAPFRITGPFLDQPYSTGWMVWYVGAPQTIQWSSQGIPEDHLIERVRLVSSSLKSYDIVTRTPNDGSETIIVPELPVGSYRIRMETTTDGKKLMDWGPAIAVSRDAFITVISPNGGEVWSLGSTQNIRWSSTRLSPDALLSLKMYTRVHITASPLAIIATSTPNDGEETYQVPQVVANEDLWKSVIVSVDCISNCGNVRVRGGASADPFSIVKATSTPQ